VNVGPANTLRGINEVDAMILEVLESLSLVPFELHLQSVYTDSPGCNPVSCCPITPQFVGRALTSLTWHLTPHGPLQLFVMRHAVTPSFAASMHA